MQTISWEEYTDPHSQLATGNSPLALTVGVFDGVHLGHQALIRQICPQRSRPPKGGLPFLNAAESSCAGTCCIDSSTPLNGAQTTVPPPEAESPLLIAHCSLLIDLLPTVVTFTQNPLKTLRPDTFAGDIYTLEQKLGVLEDLGVKLAVLIDFSGEFCKMNGRDFIDLLLGRRPVKLIALGGNFRCGHGLDTGVDEIRSLATARGVETRVVVDVMDDGRPVSSSRIRQALADGRIAEAERLLGRGIRD